MRTTTRRPSILGPVFIVGILVTSLFTLSFSYAPGTLANEADDVVWGIQVGDVIEWEYNSVSYGFEISKKTWKVEWEVLGFPDSRSVRVKVTTGVEESEVVKNLGGSNIIKVDRETPFYAEIFPVYKDGKTLEDMAKETETFIKEDGWTDMGDTLQGYRLKGATIGGIMAEETTTLELDIHKCTGIVTSAHWTYTDRGSSPSYTNDQTLVMSTNFDLSSRECYVPPPPPPPPDEDSDNDGLPDSWEQRYFGNLDQSGTDDFDNDGRTNFEEYQAGTDPTKKNGNQIKKEGIPLLLIFIVITGVIVVLIVIRGIVMSIRSRGRATTRLNYTPQDTTEDRQQYPTQLESQNTPPYQPQHPTQFQSQNTPPYQPEYPPQYKPQNTTEYLREY